MKAIERVAWVALGVAFALCYLALVGLDFARATEYAVIAGVLIVLIGLFRFAR